MQREEAHTVLGRGLMILCVSVCMCVGVSVYVSRRELWILLYLRETARSVTVRDTGSPTCEIFEMCYLVASLFCLVCSHPITRLCSMTSELLVSSLTGCLVQVYCSQVTDENNIIVV